LRIENGKNELDIRKDMRIVFQVSAKNKFALSVGFAVMRKNGSFHD